MLTFFLWLLGFAILAYGYRSIDWTWLNPYNIKKGLVLGSVVRHEAWKARDKAQAHEAAKVATEKADKEFNMYESVEEPVQEPIEVTVSFFGGSDATTKRQRIEPLTGADQLDGVIGTIQGGVRRAPREYLDKFSGRHAGAFISKAWKKRGRK